MNPQTKENLVQIRLALSIEQSTAAWLSLKDVETEILIQGMNEDFAEAAERTKENEDFRSAMSIAKGMSTRGLYVGGDAFRQKSGHRRQDGQ